MNTRHTSKYTIDAILLCPINECEKIIERVKNIRLKKTTGHIRTMYPIENRLWEYYQNKLNNTKCSIEKTQLHNNMRHTLLIVNKEIDQQESIKKEKDKASKKEERERIKKRNEIQLNYFRQNPRRSKRLANMTK